MKKYTKEDLLHDDEKLTNEELFIGCLKDLWTIIDVHPELHRFKKTANIWNERLSQRLKIIRGDGELVQWYDRHGC